VTTAHYRLLSPGGDASEEGSVSEEGSADVVVGDGTLVLTPSAGDVLRVPFSQIAAVAEGEQFSLRIALARGAVIELSRLGVMRTQLLAELKEAQAESAAQSASVVGEADIFTGLCVGQQGRDQQVDLRIYDDALMMTGSSGSERISFSFVRDVRSANYVVTVEVSGRDPVELSRLGNRTGEFTEALGKRLSAARGRTSAFLGSLLPGLDPMALRQAAGLLRDGVAVPASTLNGIHPELADSLISLSALPERRAEVADLARLGELAIGFRQIVSVHKDAEGVTPWQDHAVTPHIGGHESRGGSFSPGFGGMLAAGLMSGLGPGGGFGGGGFGGGGFGGGGFGGFGGGAFEPGGYGGYGDYWAYRALGAGMNTPQQRPMTQRPDMTRGRLTPATEDLARLTATGDSPTVLAFVLVAAADRVVFEILNLAEPATLVFRAAGQDGLAAVNRALVDTGFAAPAGGGLGAAAPAGRGVAMSELLVGQVEHGEQWAEQVGALASGRQL
jgi:hypothetical protein